MRKLSALFLSLVLFCVTALPYNQPVKKEAKVDFKSLHLAHIDSALGYVGVVESTGKNDGYEIEKFLAYVGLKKGNPYCAAFVSYNLNRCKVSEPTVRSPLAVNFITKKSIRIRDIILGTKQIPPGAIFVMQQENTLKGHVGFITGYSGNTIYTVEANTSPQKGTPEAERDGGGIYERVRTLETIGKLSPRAVTPVIYRT